MQYTISYQNPVSHFIDITLKISNISSQVTQLQLPSWRPGRYELGNFAENIQKFSISNSNGKAFPFKKISKDRWEVDTKNTDDLIVCYNYYAYKMDAGNSWLDEEQLYINFINCMIYDPNTLSESCEVILNIPSDYVVACGLPQTKKNILTANNFYHLVECPMIASNQLKKVSYTVDDHQFNLWFMGECQMNFKKVVEQFEAFTKEQIETMHGFPTKEYHFLFQILPYKFYHGVEHYNSTVIALGPSEEINSPELYENFLGVSSHELFHTWNAIRIKPKEFIPYDFTKENYFRTGFVAEGFTTYYGDLFLIRGNVLGKNWYFREVSKLLTRHLGNYGRHNLSLSESSFDLWLDGYRKGIPDRKVSIYVKGALIALMLDLEIRKATKNTYSLDAMMTSLWDQFGDTKNGYLTGDVKAIASQLTGYSMDNFFNDYIEGTQPIERGLIELLKYVGCEINVNDPENIYEKNFGFKTSIVQNELKVASIFPGSIAYHFLSPDDVILAINGRKVANNLNALIGHQTKVVLTLFRQNQLKNITLENSSNERYFYEYELVQCDHADSPQKENFKNWLKCEW